MKKKIISFALAVAMAFGFAALPADVCEQPVGVTVSAAEPGTLPAPQNVTAKAGDGKVTLTWKAVRDADAYRVYMYDSATKKYKKVTSTKKTTVTVSKLTNGKTYKFKVAAMVALPDSYKVGKTSAAVSVTPKKGESSTSTGAAMKMKKTTLNPDKMLGTWEYYDFSTEITYVNGTKYDPTHKGSDNSTLVRRFCAIATNYVVAIVNNDLDDNDADMYIYKINNGTLIPRNKDYSVGNLKYKIYSYGSHYFMFIQWKNKYSYIYKFVPTPEYEKVTGTQELEGDWKCVDYLLMSVTDPDLTNYNPDKTAYPYQKYFKKIQIKKASAYITFYEGTTQKYKISGPEIGGCPYKLYRINDELYLFLQWQTEDGDYTYVFKKS